jgi:hypothetical protein
MKTTAYNPSPLETEFARVLISLQQEIEKILVDKTITHSSTDLSQDNPTVRFHLLDKEGDRHVIMVKIVQTPDPH